MCFYEHEINPKSFKQFEELTSDENCILFEENENQRISVNSGWVFLTLRNMTKYSTFSQRHRANINQIIEFEIGKK